MTLLQSYGNQAAAVVVVVVTTKIPLYIFLGMLHIMQVGSVLTLALVVESRNYNHTHVQESSSPPFTHQFIQQTNTEETEPATCTMQCWNQWNVSSQDYRWAMFLVSFLRHMNNLVHWVLVPLYTISVLCYLIGTIYRNRTVRIQKQQQQQQRKSVQPTRKTHHQPSIITTTTTSPQPKGESLEQPIDLTGAWKLVQIENLDAFLAVQSVPWALRKAAAQVLPTHHITHKKNDLTIRIDAGPIQTSTTYKINSGVVETEVRGRIFEDAVRYWHQPEDNDTVVGIVTEKNAITEGYKVEVYRRLDGDKIFMESVASFPNNPERERVVSTQVFERVMDAS